jgi:uncharacterized RDD family membrane protein YckC
MPPMRSREGPHRSGVTGAIGDAAIFPARVAARAWRDQIERAADEVISSPETARIVDRALAGPLPEEVVRSLLRNRVLERAVQELEASGELERLLDQVLASPRTQELLEQALASDELGQALRRIAAGPEIRRAIASQSAGLAEQVFAGLRRSAVRADDRIEDAVRRRDRPAASPYGGVATRGIALTIDAITLTAIWAIGGAAAGIIASLVGGVRPQWLAGTLLAIGWVIVSAGYFTLFWSAAGQTPGMRFLRVRVERPDGGGLSVGRALARTVGLALAIVPFFLGFLPALFDSRRRDLPDYLAGTVVTYAERTSSPA